MMNAAEKLNRAGRSHSGFVRIPYCLMGRTIMRNGKQRKLGGSALLLCSAIYSFSADGGTGDFTYHELEERYRISRSSSSRSVRIVLENGLAERGSSVHEYRIKGIKDNEPYLYVEDWLYHATFDLGGVPCYLSKNEVLVLSYLISFCKNKKAFVSSYRRIAARLPFGKDTVKKSIERLKGMQLVFTEGAAKNNYELSKYHVNGKLLRAKREETIVRAKGKSSAIKAADARAERERYYAARRNEAQQREEQMNARARADFTYREAEKKSRALDIRIGKAEALDLPELGDLRREQETARRIMAQRLQVMNLTPDDLLPHYACAKCRDTGYLPDGRMCDCYPERTGRLRT